MIRLWNIPLLKHTAGGLATALVLLLAGSACLAQGSPAPKMQLPADQRAYNAARATADPAQRLAAYQAFLRNYPDSKRKIAAEDQIFDTLLKYFPERSKEITKAARAQVKHAHKGNDRLDTESNVSEQLAEAGPHGVDLKDADKWAQDGLKHFNEADFDKAMEKQQAAFAKQTHAKPPTPTPKEKADNLAQRHRFFLQQKAGFETSMAAVDIAEGKLADAKTMLDEAYAIQPLDEDTNSLRGQLALADHNDAEAVQDFERAELCEDSSEQGLAPRWRTKLLELYRQQHGDSDASLTSALDTLYARMFPPPFTPAKETGPAGHTALLELFTGSACPPCVGGDLAAEGLLHAWPRKDLVVLAFDQHIPAPDPLANPDSEARANFYGSHSTPNYVLDGQKLNIYGQDREGAKDLYASLEKAVAKETALATAAHLTLTAERTSTGDVAAKAVVMTGPEDVLAKQIVMPVEKPAAKAGTPAAPAKLDTAKKPAPAPAAKPAATPTPKLVLNFALVEDDVRYSGQNGIRFHHYVVRALARPADAGFPVAAGATATLTASFDPKAISEKLGTYLAGYARENSRFGPITFLSTDTAMAPGHLYIAAWVQDPATHRVLDAAIVKVSGEAAAPPAIAAKATP